MAITKVQGVLNRTNSSSGSISISPTTTGNLIVVGAAYTAVVQTNPTVSSVTDDAGNTYTHVPSSLSPTGGNNGADEFFIATDLWYCANCLSGALTISVSWSDTTPQTVFLYAYEFSGAKTTSPVDSANTLADAGGGAHAAPTSPTLTPTQTGELLFTVMLNNGTQISSANSPWNVDTTNSGFPQTAAWTVNAPLISQQAIYSPTTMGTLATSIASFKAPSTSNPALPTTMFLVF
jgi:hypothetical protein